MCGRLTYADAETTAAAFEASVIRHHFAPAFNGAPSQLIPVVASHRGSRFLALLKWGFVPHWSATPKPRVAPVNAVAEEVRWKPMFRDAWARGQRCLVAVTGWYEWPGKVPHHIRRPDGRPFALAGVWDVWRDDADKVASCAVLTCAPTDALRPLHHRMPVVVHPDHYDAYLDPDTPADAVARLLRPDPSVPLTAVAVSTRVNSVRNQGPELVEPVAAVTSSPVPVG